MYEDLIQLNNEVFVMTWDRLSLNKYVYRTMNSKGQRIELVIDMFYHDNVRNKKYWSATLSVNKKSRGYEYGKITGKCGIESLLLAKRMFKYHLDYHTSYDSYTNVFVIWADDNRRLNAYKYGLRSLGFKIGRFSVRGKFDTGKCLYKIFNRK